MGGQVVEGHLGDLDAEHLLQAQRLGAELGPIAVVILVASSLELHRHGLRDPASRLEVAARRDRTSR